MDEAEPRDVTGSGVTDENNENSNVNSNNEEERPLASLGEDWEDQLGFVSGLTSNNEFRPELTVTDLETGDLEVLDR